MINKLSPDLINAVRCCAVEKINVVVYCNDRRSFRALKKFGVVREYPFINAVGIECFPHELFDIVSVQSVKYVLESPTVFTLDDNLEFFSVSNFGTNCPLTGKGVTICVLDTGISPHLDFCLGVNRISDFKDLVNGRDDTPYDDNGHGTFVSGVAVGNGATSARKYKGVAPQATLVSVKVIGAEGESGVFAVLDGMQWILDNRKRLNIRVCCMSFGSNTLDVNDPLKRGAEILIKNNIVVVAASGNSGLNRVKSPAASSEVIAVGAVDSTDKVADFTSRGLVSGRQKPEIYADGVDVISTLSGASYGKMSGTSVAAPYIAGACCLLLEKYPFATPQRLKEMLLRSSYPNSEGKYILRL